MPLYYTWWGAEEGFWKIDSIASHLSLRPSFSEHGAKQMFTQPQMSSLCPDPAQCWGHRGTESHLALDGWIQARALLLEYKCSYPLGHLPSPSIILLKINFLTFNYVCVCVGVWIFEWSCPWRSGEGIGFPRTWATGGCEPITMGTDNPTRSSARAVCLSAESSLQLPQLSFLC